MSDLNDVRVNGSMLPKFQGRNVRFLCKVIKNSSGAAIVQCSDGAQISLHVSPGNEITEKVIEVVGKVENLNTVQMMAWYSMATDDEDALMEIAEKTVQIIHRADIQHMYV